MKANMIDPWARAALAGCLLLAVFAPAAAQEIVVTGTLTDAAGQPAEGHRIVFREADEPIVKFTEPTGPQGRYQIALPAGGRYVPFSVLMADGQRIELDPLPAFTVVAGVRRDLQLPVVVDGDAEAPAAGFLDGDRFYLSFVEDTAVVGRLRAEGQLELSDAGSADVILARYIAAVQFRDLPNLEFGGRIGFGSVNNRPGFGDESGITDLDVWAKLVMRPTTDRLPQIAVGGLITLPTGDEGAGLSRDAISSKLFAAARFRLPRGVISAHAGLRVSGDGQSGAYDLDGEVVPSIGVGYILPLPRDVTLIVEGTFEGARFDGLEDDARLLAGVNWRPLPEGAVRLAVAGGLTDGAPDAQILAGYAFEF